MTDEHRINEEVVDAEIDPVLLGEWEVEALAEKLFVAAYGGVWAQGRDINVHGPMPSMDDCLYDAEHALTERDRRREVKR